MLSTNLRAIVFTAAVCLLSAGCASNSSSSVSSPAPTPTPTPAPTPTATATASLSPASLNFSNQAAWTTSTAQRLTLSNTGNAALTITSIAVTGDFIQTNTCGSSVAPSSQCTVSVTFAPNTYGSHSGTVTVTNNASGSPAKTTLSGTGVPPAPVETAGCTETANKTFPGCLALSSPTETAAQLEFIQANPGYSIRHLSLSKRVRPEATQETGIAFQSAFSSNTAQIAALLDGSDPNPTQTIGTLGMSALSSLVVATPPGWCFNEGLFYANHPEATAGGFPPTGQNLGESGIWLPTDGNGQACAAAELNYIMGNVSNAGQLGLALAAQMNYMAGPNLPVTAGASYDETAAINAALQQAGSQVGPFQSVSSVTVAYDGTSYTYTIAFTASDFQQTYQGTVVLTQTPGADQYTYSGVMQFALDNGTNLWADSIRYVRAGQTVLNLSARSAEFASGAVPTYDANSELDPSNTDWIGFSRFGATFDPTSTYLTGTYLYSFEGSSPSSTGPAFGQPWVFQVMQANDGTGAAFYGRSAMNVTIDDPNFWQIDHISCLHAGSINAMHNLAQYQPYEYSAADSQYEPSSTISAQIRYAPTSSCQWTDAQYSNNNTFWYDRNLTITVMPGQPFSYPTPAPLYVIADPGDSTNNYSLFGDDSPLGNEQTAVQTYINQQGYIPPTLY